MFQFGAFAPGRSRVWGLSHSEIRGSQLLCSSPRLIAALHVLLRLSVPRHPPCALWCFCSLACTFACAAPAAHCQPAKARYLSFFSSVTQYVKEPRPGNPRTRYAWQCLTTDQKNINVKTSACGASRSRTGDLLLARQAL